MQNLSFTRCAILTLAVAMLALMYITQKFFLNSFICTLVSTTLIAALLAQFFIMCAAFKKQSLQNKKDSNKP